MSFGRDIAGVSGRGDCDRGRVRRVLRRVLVTSMVSGTFIFIAGVVVGVAASAAGFFGVKWWRTGVALQWRDIPVKWRQPYLLGGAAVVAVVAAAAIIYLAVGAHRSKDSTAAESHPAGSAMSASSDATPASNGAMSTPGSA